MKQFDAGKIVGLGLVGLLLGAMAGVGEVLHVTLFVRGAEFRPMLLLDAIVIDGFAAAALGAAAGFLWAVCTRRVRSIPPVPEWSPSRRGPTRRTILKIAATSVAPVGLLSAIPIGRAVSRQGRISGQSGSASPSSPVARPAQSRATTLVSNATQPSVPTEIPPNVLLITVDTLRADQLGVYGHPYVKTPTMDGLAAQGARFALHMVQQPQTNPSHASIFTGMYPSMDGVRVHMVDKLPNTLDTMATIYAQAGYATAGLYSWMSFDPQYSNFQRGFQVYRDLTRHIPPILENPVVQQASAQYRVAEQYLALPKKVNQLTGLNKSVEEHAKGRADVTSDAAIEQIRTFGNRPFFLWLHYFDPHYPFAPPPGFANLYDPGYRGPITTDIQTIYDIENGRLKPQAADIRRLMSLYQGEITFLDSQLARLLAELDQLGITDRTVVALTGDHGESFAEHTQFEESGNYFHPHSLYNVEGRVPLLLRYPGHIAPGSVVQAPTQAIDLLPTFMQLTGLPIPAQAEGKSLLPLLDPSAAGDESIAYAMMPDYVFTSIVTQRYKLIRNNANGQRILFDLTADPGETHDLSSTQQTMADRLDVQLQRWMKAVKVS